MIFTFVALENCDAFLNLSFHHQNNLLRFFALELDCCDFDSYLFLRFCSLIGLASYLLQICCFALLAPLFTF